MNFTNEEKLALFETATKFTIYPTGTDATTDDKDNLRHHLIEVAQTGSGKWMVWSAAQQAWNNTDKKWYHSLHPEIREKLIKKQITYELKEALDIAYKLRDTVKVNGYTYAGWKEFFRTRGNN